MRPSQIAALVHVLANDHLNSKFFHYCIHFSIREMRSVHIFDYCCCTCKKIIQTWTFLAQISPISYSMKIIHKSRLSYIPMTHCLTIINIYPLWVILWKTKVRTQTNLIRAHSQQIELCYNDYLVNPVLICLHLRGLLVMGYFHINHPD